MKTARNLMGVLLLVATAYAFEPKEEVPTNDSNQTTTPAYVDLNNAIIGSDGELVQL